MEKNVPSPVYNNSPHQTALPNPEYSFQYSKMRANQENHGRFSSPGALKCFMICEHRRFQECRRKTLRQIQPRIRTGNSRNSLCRSSRAFLFDIVQGILKRNLLIRRCPLKFRQRLHHCLKIQIIQRISQRIQKL